MERTYKNEKIVLEEDLRNVAGIYATMLCQRTFQSQIVGEKY